MGSETLRLLSLAVIPVSAVSSAASALSPDDGAPGARPAAPALGPRPAAVLPGHAVPDFGVIRVGRYRVRHRLRAALRRRRLLLLATAVLCAALSALAWPGRHSPKAAGQPGVHARARPAPSAHRVLVPVRIADPASVRLLRPGDRVDVLAADDTGGPARVVAHRARVRKIPDVGERGRDGALVVLRVPHTAAARLAGAATHTSLSVTLW